MIEEWRDIEGFEGFYQVSNLGRVKSLNRKTKHDYSGCLSIKERILKFLPHTSGYLCVCLRKNNKTHRKYIHRLVAETFIKNELNKKTVNHKDGNKKNNNYKNLEFATYSENNKHAYKIGLKKPVRAFLGKFGKEHHSSKPVLQLDKETNEVIREFESCTQASIYFKRKYPTNIVTACKDNTKTAYGYKWKYKEVE